MVPLSVLMRQKRGCVSKAFLAVEGNTAAASNRIHEIVERLTAQVVDTFRRRMPSGGIVHIEDIQDQVELCLMRNGNIALLVIMCSIAKNVSESDLKSGGTTRGASRNPNRER